MGGSLLDEKTTWEEFGKGLRLGNFIQSERSKQSLWYFIVSLDTNQTHLDIFQLWFYFERILDWHSFIVSLYFS